MVAAAGAGLAAGVVMAWVCGAPGDTTVRITGSMGITVATTTVPLPLTVVTTTVPLPLTVPMPLPTVLRTTAGRAVGPRVAAEAGWVGGP